MPTKHVALLRGVNNVGKSTRVSMADLRARFEGLGFDNVRPVLDSGNVVFSAPDYRRDDPHECIQEARVVELPGTHG